VESDFGDYCALRGEVATADVDLTMSASHERHWVWRRASERFPVMPDRLPRTGHTGG
jgi:hypothetical protein